jgi:hypothetical protein
LIEFPLTPGSALACEALPAPPLLALSLLPQPAAVIATIARPAIIHLVVPSLRKCASISE